MNIIQFYLSQGFFRVSSPFGSRRDPITGRLGVYHFGVDLAAPIGTPIIAPESGLVRTSRYFSDAGNAVAFKSDRTGIMINYYHNHRLRVTPRHRVQKGDVLATVGSTGYSTGPHVHIELRHDNGGHFGLRDRELDPNKYRLEVFTIEDALKIFRDRGIILSPDYWQVRSGRGHTVSGDHLATVLRRSGDELAGKTLSGEQAAEVLKSLSVLLKNV